MEGDIAKDKEKGVSTSEKIREKYGWCSSFLTMARKLKSSMYNQMVAG